MRQKAARDFIDAHSKVSKKSICNRGVCLFLHIFMDTFRGKDRGIKKGAWSCFPYTFFVIF